MGYKVYTDGKVIKLNKGWKLEQLQGYCAEGPLVFIIPEDIDNKEDLENILKMYSGFVEVIVITGPYCFSEVCDEEGRS